ncbi:MAG TPA: monovalent cation/H+ antiporter complex subunit F [Egibacteraceae bacterium]|nr:monovalent cation/H+ antiporter complex subunit F [Egibacteraceae bacterium]
MTTVVDIGLLLIGASASLCVLAVLRRRSLADRIVALETLLITVVSGVALLTMRTGNTAFLPVLVVVAVVGFTGAVTVARFIERRGA